MKEDILEQLVDDYFQFKGYFTRHNVKFRPRPDHEKFDKRQDSNHSDIDVIGYCPQANGHDRVLAVSCKSWQAGFDVKAKLAEIRQNKRRSGRESWKFFRELVQPKWSEAFIAAVAAATGSTQFTYVTAVTRLRGPRELWEQDQQFIAAMGGNPIRILTLQDMAGAILPTLNTTVAGSQLGRTLQLLKATGAKLQWPTS